MTDKSLQQKAINIKGKDYIQVKDRILYFNETYPNGAIETKLLSSVDAQRVVVQAIVMPDADQPGRLFTGLAQEVVGQGNINRTSALENAETSAVGRALAMMGIGIIESVASADEVVKATKPAPTKQPAKQQMSAFSAAKIQISRAATLNELETLGERVSTSSILAEDEKLTLEELINERIIKLG